VAEAQLIRCQNCGATNRVPLEKVAQGLLAVCGRCKRPLVLSSGPLTVTDATFAEQVERSPIPVLLDLWAPWCGPCHMMAPTIDQLATELAGRVRVAKLNVDENPVTAGRYNARSIPTLLVLKSGIEIDRIVGVRPKADIVQRLQQVMAETAGRASTQTRS
jgi:thioredoxin 2